MPGQSRSIELAEQGLLPDPLVRAGIRRLLRVRLAELNPGDVEAAATRTEDFVSAMRAAEIAPLPALANAQHYEVPAEFFGKLLGRHRKYSCCYFEHADQSLDEAEAVALRLTAEHADLQDGQDILELGCGWGSLSLWMARHLPNARITAVSNSHSQRAYIEATARQRGLQNLTVITCDMNVFSIAARFDRIVSVEMFEHMRNWSKLFARLAGWLRPDGRFLMHVFCHRSVPYAFNDAADDDWMSRYFFSGGMMPSDELPLRCQQELQLQRRWRWNGRHYQRTANLWLANMDGNRASLWPVLESTYGKAEAQRWWHRWRVFLMACAEMWGYAAGQEWWVSHYLFTPRAAVRA